MCAAPDSDNAPTFAPRASLAAPSATAVPHAQTERFGAGDADGAGADGAAGAGAGAEADPRARAAWRTWLSALANDAEAAMAAALAYDSLEGEARDAWLDVLEQDAPGLDVPLVALYAPLLSVEAHEPRRMRMAAAMAPTALVTTSRDDVLALRGVDADGSLVCAIVSPVYLHFVEVLVCRYTRDDGFVTVEHDQLRHIDDVPRHAGARIAGVVVEETPLRVVVEELAHAILADRRADRAPPPALLSFVHIFGPDFEDGSDPS